MWSVESPDAVAQYLKWHAMQGWQHCKAKGTERLAESDVNEIINNIDIQETIDTFASRQRFQKAMKIPGKRKAEDAWQSDTWKKPKPSTWELQNAPSWRGAPSEAGQSSADKAVKNLEERVRGWSHHASSKAHSVAMPALFAAPLQLFDDQLVTLSQSQATHMLETVTRNKEAAKQVMASMLGPMGVLQTQCEILANTEQMLQHLIDQHLD